MFHRPTVPFSLPIPRTIVGEAGGILPSYLAIARSRWSVPQKDHAVRADLLYPETIDDPTKLLSNPDVSPQVSREIAGHISQAMQSRYSIQLFNKK
jgi:hypothetical protein